MMIPFGCIGACHVRVTSRDLIESTVGRVTSAGTVRDKRQLFIKWII